MRDGMAKYITSVSHTSYENQLRYMASHVQQEMQAALINILRYGAIPRHVSMIMDGNRRYARQRGLSVKEGHSIGFGNVADIIGVLRRLGVHTMSFFMFGVDNFKRTPEEVANLMDIIKDDLSRWAAPGGIAHQLEVQLVHCGERDLLEPDVVEVLDHVMDVTRDYRKGRVNLFIAYSGTREVNHGLCSRMEDFTTQQYHKGVKEPFNLSSSLSTRDSIPLDLLIRTSGATRLSDFMLWQCSDQTELVFLDCFWPQFGAWQLALAILRWRSRTQYRWSSKLASALVRNSVAGLMFISISLLLVKVKW